MEIDVYNIIKNLDDLSVFIDLNKDNFIINLKKAFAKEKFRNKFFARAMNILMEEADGSISEYFKEYLRKSENVYIKRYSQNKKITSIMQTNYKQDIDILNGIINGLPAYIFLESEEERFPGGISGFNIQPFDVEKFYNKILANSVKNGYGKWANYNMFMLSPKGKIKPIANSQPLEIQDLYKYEREKQIIFDNTKRLVEGKLAQNVLLTGDAGCGKSSSIKAIANSFKHEGLRIIEVKKSQITQIAKLLGKLEQLNLKFIIFIDDVSYSQGDEDYNALKALLEGSCVERAKNIAIYATSNRRHMIAEKFSDRDGDDMHVNDVIQEQISLSDRFGIHVTFSRPSKDVYLEIVKKLAHKHHVKTSAELLAEAEKFALARGGRSARVAKQFIEMQE